MGAPLDIKGKRFGRLVAVAPVGTDPNGAGVIWHCECDCGGFAKLTAGALSSGGTRSCGCLFEETRTLSGRLGGKTRRAMGLKTWGTLGTGNSRTGDPAFLARRMGDESKSEVERRNADRNRRGICLKCGRPLALSNIEGSTATLICSCGFRTTTKRGSRAYRAAAVKSECERASR